jgi:hypothetical protein
MHNKNAIADLLMNACCFFGLFSRRWVAFEDSGKVSKYDSIK